MRVTHIGYALILMAAAFTASACDGRNPSGPSAVPAVAAASYDLTGDVIGAGGAGLAGVEITFSRADGSERRATSDADGRFRISLDAGDWTAALKCKGYADRSVDVVVNGNATISFELLPAL